MAERRLREYLSECRGLYSRGTVTVNVGRRILAADQMAAIKSILGQETGLTVTRYWCPPDVLSRALAGPASIPDPRRALPPPVANIAANLVDDFDPSSAAADQKLDAPVSLRKDADQGPSTSGGSTASGDAVRRREPEGRQLSMQFSDFESEQSSGHPPRRTQDAGEGPRLPSTSGPPAADGGQKAPSAPDAKSIESSETVNGQDREAAAGEIRETEQSALSASGGPWADVDSPSQTMLSRGAEALIIKNTCRSGEVVRYPGDVVVFGDVNPGAEIVAGGDIMVLGALRGMAHAGSKGNLKATIFALNLESHRLQIGSHSGERPRASHSSIMGSRGSGKGKNGSPQRVNPQIAYLRRGSIFVAPFSAAADARVGPSGGREYYGGVPYEG
jgi:septum formation inhibitor MinC